VDGVRSIITKPKNRQILSWICGGIAALAAGSWTVVTYIWPAHEAPQVVCAQQGGIASGRDASGNTTNYTGNYAGGAPSGAGGGVASCVAPAKK
jgi:hypothetical protein